MFYPNASNKVEVTMTLREVAETLTALRYAHWYAMKTKDYEKPKVKDGCSIKELVLYSLRFLESKIPSGEKP